MTLEERYNAAGNESYVGRVKNRQAADAGDINGVNFLDGDGRGQWAPGQTPPPDVVQNEFKRNNAGDYRYGGGGKSPAGTNNGSYPLSRWLERGTEKGDTYMTNNRYTTITDVRNASNIIYKFSPLEGKSFYDAGGLSEFAKNRADPKAGSYGPAVGGING